MADGYRNQCKSCYREKQRRSAYQHRYGISYEKACEMQNSPCEICGSNDEPCHIDHDHDTGQVRGSLCPQCNKAIGLLQDSSEIVLQAAAYLKIYGK
jgi:hypothetical protein